MMNEYTRTRLYFPNNAVFLFFNAGILAFIIAACSSSQPVQSSANEFAVGADTVALEKPALEKTEKWVIREAPEQFLRPRTWNLQHQKIWVRFDYEREAVLGETELLLTSISNTNSSLVLDGKTMEIHGVYDVINSRPLDVVQDSSTITMNFDTVYSAGDTIIVRIEYTAFPPKRGLYFVNADGSDDSKPTQIWTLGQPEDNSFWLPTIDHPAERTTQETWISVRDEFQTLSNGALIESKTLPGDSLRTDYWYMDRPHAPYLFALAVGEYEIFEELVDGVVLKYYTEPQFAPYFSTIYRDTDDMLRYFTDKLGVEYPWAFYAQAPVHDFIASGMENTTATLLFDRVQITERQSMDVDFQDLIAHELIHQWFGNLVTCKDWANLPLNEGFANYFETLYRNHRNGPESAAWKALTDRQNYFREADSYRRPVISNRYFEPEDMYDRHTYEKAGQILRMLHHLVGEEHWWGALNRLLTDYEYTAIDWRDVQKVFEQETGLVLTNFFQQWYKMPGHPNIKVTTTYSNGSAYVKLEQTQSLEHQIIFDLDLDIHYFDDVGNNLVQSVNFNTADSTYVIDDPKEKIGELVVDPERVILAQYSEDLNPNELISRLAHPSVILRFDAIMELSSLMDDAEQRERIVSTLRDAFAAEIVPELREAILAVLTPHMDASWEGFLHGLTIDNEPFYRNRMRAASLSLQHFGVQGNEFINSLLEDPSYYVERHANRIILEYHEQELEPQVGQ